VKRLAAAPANIPPENLPVYGFDFGLLKRRAATLFAAVVIPPLLLQSG